MATVLNPPKTAEARVVLPNVSWGTYERLITDLSDCSVPHLTYDQGRLEIMSPTAKHEKVNRSIELLVRITALEMNIEVASLGSTTFKREDIARGFEPDSCFYVQNEAAIRGKEELDLLVDPPPDIVFEVDITSSSIDKRSLFAHFGVPEVWRYDDENIEILNLVNSAYVKSESSLVLPFLTAKVLTDFIAESLTLSGLEWLKNVRNWAQQQKAAE
ncbi:MAG: Uma2 family endonuclease [Acidobacteriota bacterium]|nr:Uma2 family endonuclease [Acidobacteriota bacterium]